MECLTMGLVNDQGHMNNEWSRYLSFLNFPKDSCLMPTRLAQAGFYYTGSGEKVICFCCGIQNEIWTEDETVLDVHRRLSPHCRYICGEDTTNIPMHEHRSMMTVTVPECSKGSYISKENKQEQSGSQVKHSTGEKGESKDDSGSYGLTSNTAEQGNKTCVNKRNLCVKGVLINHALLDKPAVSHVHINQNYDIRTNDVPTHSNGLTELYPGITDVKPKHPDYSLMSRRLISFTEWPAWHVMDPAVLAKAGFYYAGIHDCVRCFFCSGGMKNWELGDNPWVEHARWFPDCAYVKLCKGEPFIKICRSAINSGHGAIHDIELQSEQENIPEDWLIEGINSTAAKIVLSAGYRQEDVEKGIVIAVQKYGVREVKAQFIMEYIQEADKQTSKQQLSASSGNSKISNHVHQPYSEEIIDKAYNSTIDEKGENETSKNLLRTENRSKHKSEKQRLLEENRTLKDLITCKICFDNDACVAFLPCGHLASCVECSKSLRKCAVCRTVVQATVRVYQA